MNQICCLLISVILLGCLPQVTANASRFDTCTSHEDIVVLDVGIGNGKGDLNYSATLAGGGKGPEAFTVTADESIYIVDNVNKRVNVYKNGTFINEIDAPFIAYVRSMVVSRDLLYLMDYDGGCIYILDMDGKMVDNVTIPEHMESYRMRRLYVQNDGHVCLYYENGEQGSSTKGADYSYPVDELGNTRCIGRKGFSKDDDVAYSIEDQDVHYTSIATESTGDSAAYRRRSDIQIRTDELLGSARILNVAENDSVYVDVFEILNTSIVMGEYTVRKYVNGECRGIARVDLEQYYFMPNNVLEVSESGDLYQIICYADKVQIVKKAFVAAENFTTTIISLKEKAADLEMEADKLNAAAETINAPNNRNTTMTYAIQCCNLEWTYTADNAVNPDSTKITAPNYLANALKPSDQEGIPYCWGGFDGINTSSSSSWSNFTDAMSKKKFAGNVNTSTSSYQSGTAGFDCSGFVSSTAGFTSKLSTRNLASSTYTKEISESDRKIYDMYVKSGSHVMYYVGTTTNGIQTREATTSGTEKTKLYTRSLTELYGYTLRRFNGW